MLANPRRTAIGFTPFFVILIAAGFFMAGVFGAQLYFFVVTGANFFMLGQLSIILSDKEASRRASVAHMEGFIGHLHGVLARDELDDEERRSAEVALSSAVQALDQLERSASRWTRRRERRAREKASQ